MNVGTLLTKAARTFPGNLAVVHGPRRLTYAQFNARVNRLANALARLGVGRGDHVALLQYSYPETLESMFACFKAGCGVVPINFRLHPNEYGFILDHSESKAVILSGEFNDGVLAIRDRIPGAQHLITLEGGSGPLLDYEALLAAEPPAWQDVAVHPDDVAWLFYTSGTTGLPKGAMLTHRNLLAMVMNVYADICPGLGPADVILHARPLSHGSGLYALPTIGKAAANVILESKTFDPELVLATIAQYRRT
jgi:acyl-CoA synthetase (AMP-forming)/AMP-acid ligase II